MVSLHQFLTARLNVFLVKSQKKQFHKKSVLVLKLEKVKVYDGPFFFTLLMFNEIMKKI